MKPRTDLLYMLLTLSILAVLGGIMLFSQGVFRWGAGDFPDKNLEAAIRYSLGVPKGRLTAQDLARVTDLDASNRGIKSLQGMEQLYALRTLNLENNFIQDVSPLQNLHNLTELSLRNNGITCLQEINFAELSGLPLKKLSLRHNVVRPESGGQVRLSDASLLRYFTKLEELELRDNHISQISFLSQLVRLEELDLRENHIRDLTPLAGLTGLTHLNIQSNPKVKSIFPLKDLTGLQTLIMRNVPVKEEIDILKNMLQLRRLNLGSCLIDDISALEGLIELEELDLRDNNIIDLSPLASLDNLVYVNLQDNPNVQSLEPLRNLAKLEIVIKPDD